MSTTATTKITAHGIMMDTRSESGQWIYVIECPVSQQVELVRRFDGRSNANCPCGHLI